MPQVRIYVDAKFQFEDGEELAPRIEALIAEHLATARETGPTGVSVYPEGTVRHMVYIDP